VIQRAITTILLIFIGWQAKFHPRVSDSRGSGYILDMIINRRPTDGAPPHAHVDFSVDEVPLARGGVTIDAIVNGKPTDPKVTRLLTVPYNPTCNNIALGADEKPIKQESARRDTFSVRR